jgi:hypothetical protein
MPVTLNVTTRALRTALQTLVQNRMNSEYGAGTVLVQLRPPSTATMQKLRTQMGASQNRLAVINVLGNVANRNSIPGADMQRDFEVELGLYRPYQDTDAAQLTFDDWADEVQAWLNSNSAIRAGLSGSGLGSRLGTIDEGASRTDGHETVSGVFCFGAHVRFAVQAAVDQLVGV